MTTSQTCKACGETKAIEAFDQYPSGVTKVKCRVCVNEARYVWRDARNANVRLEREKRSAALSDDIWSAMHRGRSTRALEAVKDHREGMHRIRLKDRSGYISIVELACRHAEREACTRAARNCKTFEFSAAAVRILEQPTPTVERTREIKSLWRIAPTHDPLDALKVTLGDREEDKEADAFDGAFGDWAPAWMQTERLAA